MGRIAGRLCQMVAHLALISVNPILLLPLRDYFRNLAIHRKKIRNRCPPYLIRRRVMRTFKTQRRVQLVDPSVIWLLLSNKLMRPVFLDLVLECP